MRRYFIKFSYFGTNYRGIQKNTISTSKLLMHDIGTVQGALESAFTVVHPKCVKWPRITCSSRTDVGVHSLCNTAHIDLENRSDTIYEPNNVLKYVNRYFTSCQHNIRLLEFIPVNNDFHARALAKSRTYLYRFLIAKDPNNHKIPLAEAKRCYHLRHPNFDIERMKRGAQLFMGKKDFRTFSAKSESYKPIRYVRALDSITIERGQPLMPYDSLSQNFDYWNLMVTSKGFLYKQIRRIVGTLVCLAEGKITERDIQILLQVPGHHHFLKPLHTAPAIGLYLLNVDYCPEEIEEYSIKYRISPDNLTVIPIEDDPCDEMLIEKSV